MVLLDGLFPRETSDRWNAFYADRDRPVPFFRMAPDESLVAWRDTGLLTLGAGVRVLDLGCGPGRNAVWLAQQSIFEVATGPYDLVVDSGCLHHLPPHRRVSYLALLDRVLARGGALALTTFGPGGSDRTDEQAYREGDLGGGLVFTEEDLGALFTGWSIEALRPMRACATDSGLFGEDLLLVALLRRGA